MEKNLKPLSADFLYINTGSQLRSLIYQLAVHDASHGNCPPEKVSKAAFDAHVAYMYRRAYFTGIAFFKEARRAKDNRYESLMYQFSGRIPTPSMVYLPYMTQGGRTSWDWFPLPKAGFILTFNDELQFHSPVAPLNAEEARHMLSVVYNQGAIYDGRF